MVNVFCSTIINAPAPKVWKILRDFGGHDQWHPAVDRSYVEGGLKTDQVGAVRNFVLTGGERLREKLLMLSDKDHYLCYKIIETDVPLLNYFAEISLKSVTDGDQTFWSWHSSFQTPKGRETELENLVTEKVYEVGFDALRHRVESRPLRRRFHCIYRQQGNRRFSNDG